MSNIIKIKKSAVTGVIPSDLAAGELAINTKDKKLFFLDSLGVLQSFDLFTTLLTLKSLESYVFSNTAYALVSQVALQKIFNNSPNVVIAGLSYFFECNFTISAMSALLGNFGFGFLGTATISSLSYTAISDKADATGSPSMGQIAVGITTAETVLVSSSAIRNGNSIIKGIISVNGSGTLIPAVSLSTAAAAIIGKNSWFRIVVISSTIDNFKE
jgi:hypothetical protein